MYDMFMQVPMEHEGVDPMDYVHIMLREQVLLKGENTLMCSIFQHMCSPYYITNLTCHNLVLEIVQNLFIHNSYISRTNIMHWKHI